MCDWKSIDTMPEGKFVLVANYWRGFIDPWAYMIALKRGDKYYQAGELDELEISPSYWAEIAEPPSIDGSDVESVPVDPGIATLIDEILVRRGIYDAGEGEST